MKELKTLKDLEVSNNQALFSLGAKIQREELIKEAIKWAKAISKGGFNKVPEIKFESGELDCSEVTKAILTQESSIVVDWIMHFFNLSEEDLE